MNMLIFVWYVWIACLFIGTIWLVIAQIALYLRSRRSIKRVDVLTTLTMLIYMIVMTLNFMGFRSLSRTYVIAQLSMLLITPMLIVGMTIYNYWFNKKPVYGFTHTRDILLLRKPIDPVEQPHDPSKGLFVPNAPIFLQSDESPTVRPWWFMPVSIMLGVAIVVVFFAIVRLLVRSPLGL